MVFVLGLPLVATIRNRSQTPLFPAFHRDFQPFSTPQARHSRVARRPVFGSQQTTESAIAELRSLSRQLSHPLDQVRLVFARCRLVTLRAARLF